MCCPSDSGSTPPPLRGAVRRSSRPGRGVPRRHAARDGGPGDGSGGLRSWRPWVERGTRPCRLHSPLLLTRQLLGAPRPTASPRPPGRPGAQYRRIQQTTPHTWSQAICEAERGTGDPEANPRIPMRPDPRPNRDCREMLTLILTHKDSVAVLVAVGGPDRWWHTEPRPRPITYTEVTDHPRQVDRSQGQPRLSEQPPPDL